MKKRLKQLLIIIIIMIILSIILIYIYSKKISPVIMKYALIDSKKIGISIISKGVNEEVTKILDNNDIFYIEKDKNDVVETIDYNTKVVNELLSIVSRITYDNLKDIEKNNNGIITRIPIGVVTDNVFFNNLGPKVPVKINLDGNVLTSLKSDVKEYGLNSALIQISVKVEANIDVIIPLKVEKIIIVNEVPVSIKIIKGNVSSIFTGNK